MKNFFTLEILYLICCIKFLFRKEKIKLKYRCSVKRVSFDGWNVISSGAYVTDTLLGRHSYVGLDSVVNNASVGAFTCIGPRVVIGVGVHPTNRISIHPAFYSKRKQSGFSFVSANTFKEHCRTFIGNDVWIGAGVVIKDGVRVGDGAIVGAGSVVTKDVEDYSIVVGAPAKQISKRLTEEIRAEILLDPWWNKSDSVLAELLPDFELEYDD